MKKETEPLNRILLARIGKLERALSCIMPSFTGFVSEVTEPDGRLHCYRDELARLKKEARMGWEALDES